MHQTKKNQGKEEKEGRQKKLSRQWTSLWYVWETTGLKAIPWFTFWIRAELHVSWLPLPSFCPCVHPLNLTPVGEESTSLPVWKPPRLNLIFKTCQVWTKSIYVNNLKCWTFWMKKSSSFKLAHWNQTEKWLHASVWLLFRSIYSIECAVCDTLYASPHYYTLTLSGNRTDFKRRNFSALKAEGINFSYISPLLLLVFNWKKPKNPNNN